MRAIALLPVALLACSAATAEDGPDPDAGRAPDATPRVDAGPDARAELDAAAPPVDAAPDGPDESTLWGTLGHACLPDTRTCTAPAVCFPAHTFGEPWYDARHDVGDLYMRCTIDCDDAQGKASCGAAGGRCEKLTMSYYPNLPKTVCIAQ